MSDDLSYPLGGGPTGKSAYDLAVEQGYIGTHSQWIASLVGLPGSPGSSGIPGTPGAKGDQGIQGIQGVKGDTGATGSPGTNGTNGSIGLTGAAGDTRVKFAKSDLVTAATGILAVALGGANKFTGIPALNITPKMATGTFSYRYALSGSAVAGWIATITFSKRKDNISILLLGAFDLFDAPVAVTFDLTATEQTP